MIYGIMAAVYIGLSLLVGAFFVVRELRKNIKEDPKHIQRIAAKKRAADLAARAKAADKANNEKIRREEERRRQEEAARRSTEMKARAEEKQRAKEERAKEEAARRALEEKRKEDAKKQAEQEKQARIEKEKKMLEEKARKEEAARMAREEELRKLAIKKELERQEKERLMKARESCIPIFLLYVNLLKNHKIMINEIDSRIQIIGGVWYFIFDNYSLVAGCNGNSKAVTISDSISFKNKTIPVIGILENSFKNNNVLKEIIIPCSIELIGDNAFSGCYQLKTIVLPDSVKYVGARAFASCLSLGKVTLSRETIVEPNTFEMCNNCSVSYR